MATTETVHPLVRAAMEQLRSGQAAAAEATLSRLLAAEPRHADALGILGFLRYRQGRLDDAAGLLKRALAARPAHLEAQLNLAYVLRDQGNAEQAILAFAAVLTLKPDLMEAHLQRGMLLHDAGRLAEAEQAYRAMLTLFPGNAMAMLPLSAVLIAAGRPAEAEAVARDALPRTGDKVLRASLEQNLAIALGQQYRIAELLQAYGRAQAANPDLRHLDYRRACLLEETGRFDEALALFRDVLSREPLHLEAHRDYNALLYRLKRDDEFLHSYDVAAARAPGGTALALAKADFLISAARPDEAFETFGEALRRDPDNFDALTGKAVALTRMKRFDDALDLLQTLIARAPDRSNLYGDASAVLAQMRDAPKALELAQKGAAINPFDQPCLALIGTAYRMLGDAREERHNGYDSLVRVMDLEPPEGFADMASFNAELNAYLDGMHPDLREFVTQTLRGGTQTTNNIFGVGHVLVEKLRHRIDEALARYIAELGADETHPYVARRRRDFAYSGSWSSRLRDCGFHVNHLHTGWISSCYYIAVPREADDENAMQGWIKFGEPSYDVGLAQPTARAVKPVPGRLVLFPSYTWHGTVPFRSAAARTTIAFDVLPV